MAKARRTGGARSINARQKDYLKTLHLDQIGSGKIATPVVELDAIEQLLVDLAIIFVEGASAGLNETDNIHTGFLHDSISFDAVSYMGGVYAVEISVADYYDFINKGVRGTVSTPEGAQGSPYQFKNTGVSKAMLTSIRKWVIREGLKASSKPAQKGPINREGKGKPFSVLSRQDSSTNIAYGVAKNIKKHGIKGSHFWDKAAERVSRAIAIAGGSIAPQIFVNELSKK